MAAQFLRRRAVAKLLAVSERSLEAWRRRGLGPPCISLPGVRVVLYDEARLLAWVRANERARKCSDNGAASIVPIEPEIIS